MFCSGLSALVLHKVLKYQWKAKQNERLCIVIALPLYFFFYNKEVHILKLRRNSTRISVPSSSLSLQVSNISWKMLSKTMPSKNIPSHELECRETVRWQQTDEQTAIQENSHRTRIAWNKFIPAWYQPRNEDHQQARNADLKISSTLNFQTPSYCESLKKSIPQIAFVSKYLAMNNEYR